MWIVSRHGPTTSTLNHNRDHEHERRRRRCEILVQATLAVVVGTNHLMLDYRIAGIFRGYTFFVYFADQVCTVNINTHELNIACMHAAKGCYSAKIKSAKTFLTVFLRQFTPSKYAVRCTVVQACAHTGRTNHL